MKIHNIMEDEVNASVNEIYEQLRKKETPWITCDCEQCRSDVTALVLNQTPPRYIVSGRGVIYNIATNNLQRRADIDARVMNAIKVVSSVKRPYHNQKKNAPVRPKSGPVFNFPTFTGAVFDGTNFEPIAGASVTLKYNDTIAEMIDYTWTNPCKTDSHTKAEFSFWVKSIPAEKENENRVFPFVLEISARNYEDLIYAFNVPLVSQNEEILTLNAAYSLKLPDLFLFPPTAI